MSVEIIIRKINSDADLKIKSIMQRMKDVKDDIRDRMESEKSLRMDELKKRNEREILIMKNRIISHAKLERKKKILKKREEEIDEVLNRALKDARKMGSERYGAYLEGSIAKITSLLDGSITIHCTGDTCEVLKDIVGTDSRVVVEADLSGIKGIIGVSEDGTTLDMTLESNLQRMRKELRKEVASILFPEEN